MANTITEIKLENLKNHPKNTRKSYTGINELAESIKKNGILQNLTVVPDPEENGKFLVVIGNRRLRAAQKAGLKTAPCVITEMDEAEQVMTTLVENMQRNDLTLMEEAAGIQMCLQDYGIGIDTLAEKTGLSKSTIRHRIHVSKLDPDILDKKMNHSEFQLTITDIQKLERIKNVYRRSEILDAAEDPKNLAWRIEQEVASEEREKNLKKMIALAKKEGIVEAPEGTNIYSYDWEIIKECHLNDDVPEQLLPTRIDPDEDVTFYYILVGNMLRIIRKREYPKPAAETKDDPQKPISAKAEGETSVEEEKKKSNSPALMEDKKPEISPEQLRYNRIQSCRAKHRDLWNCCYAELHDFYQSILSGKIEAPEHPEEIIEICWKSFLDDEVYLDRETILEAILDCNVFQASGEDYQKAVETMGEMPIYLQMLSILYLDTRGLDLMNHSAEYVEEAGERLHKLIDCFKMFGFSFSNEEFDALADGTHEVYFSEDNEDSDLSAPDIAAVNDLAA